MQSPFNVLILLLLAIYGHAATLISRPPTNMGSSPFNITSALTASRPRLNDTIHDTVLRTLERYPTAHFIKVQASVSTEDPTTDPLLLTDIQLIFSVPNRLPAKTLISQMRSRWATWENPRLVDLDYAATNDWLPSDLEMDILEADQRIKEAGWAGRYYCVDVRWPKDLGGHTPQPYYIFSMEDEPELPSIVSVGIYDKQVMAQYFNALDQWEFVRGRFRSSA